jgi:hypothetical protein
MPRFEANKQIHFPSSLKNYDLRFTPVKI